jgi:hypothetical protein
MPYVVAALLLFGAGYLLGNHAGSDIAPAVDTLVVQSARTDTLYRTVAHRDTVVRTRTTVLEGRIDTLEREVYLEAPDSLRPKLDSLRAMHALVVELWRSQSEEWRAVADSLKRERDVALVLLQTRVKKPSPVQFVIGVAMTPRGIQPALAVGLRIHF